MSDERKNKQIMEKNQFELITFSSLTKKIKAGD